MVDKDLRVIFFNDGAVLTAKQLLNFELKAGVSVLDMAKPGQHELLLEWFKDVLDGRSHQTESVIDLPDGNHFYLHHYFTPARNHNGEIVSAIVTSRNITDTKLAEIKLQQSEEKYRVIFTVNPLPSLIYDFETLRFLEVNDAAVTFYGYSKEEFLKLTWKDILIEEDIPILFQDLDNFGKIQKPLNNNWSHRKKNGDIVYVEIKENDLIYNGKGARLAVVNDITMKVESDTELIRSTERFLLASKATSDAIWDWDLTNNELKWGEGIFTLFGYHGKDVPIEKWFQLIHKDDEKRIRESLLHAINDTTTSFWRNEYRFQKADGSYRYILDHGYLVRDQHKKAIRMIGAMKDITELKEKEQVLSSSIERYNIIAKATHDLIWDWDLNAGELYRNLEGLKKVYGVADNESIKHINSWFQRIHPDDLYKMQHIIQDILHSADQETFEVEYRFKRDDGTYSYVYDRGYIMRDAEGNPYRIIGAAQDITERKQLEHELLEQELNRQKAISQATIDTQEKERGEIGKELHDNVNQVLTTTKLFLDLAATNSELKDELINKSSRNIIYVINEIRQLSRSLMLPSLGDLGLIDSIRDLVENINATHKLQVTFLVPSFDEKILEENQKLMIFRITQETLNNVLKHAEATIATVHLMSEKNHAKLIIKDDGKGFNLKRVKQGTGLNNIRNRVYLFNGTLVIHTSPGKGCEIVIDIPLQTNPA